MAKLATSESWELVEEAKKAVANGAIESKNELN